MGKFQFKYHTVKNVKDLLEKKVQKEVSAIENQILDYKEQYDSYMESLADCKNSRHNVKKIFEIKIIEDHQKFLSEQIYQIENKIKLLESKKDEKLSELTEKNKEKKIFETLEESAFNNFIYEEMLKEEKILDDFSSQKIARERS